MREGYTLPATRRERVGKGAARALRRDGQIPAVIYGDKKDPLSVAIPYKDATLLIQRGGFMTTVGAVDVDGQQHRVIARDYQLEPVRDFLMHVDFLRVSGNMRLAVMLPVHFENEDIAPGLKAGGVLNVVRHEVECECPADAIPEALILDLKDADLGDSLHISAVNLPEGVTPTITDRDFTIATIAAPAGLKSEESEAEEEGEEGAAEESGEE